MGVYFLKYKDTSGNRRALNAAEENLRSQRLELLAQHARTGRLLYLFTGSIQATRIDAKEWEFEQKFEIHAFLPRTASQCILDDIEQATDMLIERQDFRTTFEEAVEMLRRIAANYRTNEILDSIYEQKKNAPPE